MASMRSVSPLTQLLDDWTPDKINACKDIDLLIQCFIRHYKIVTDINRPGCVNQIKYFESRIQKKDSSNSSIDFTKHLALAVNKLKLMDEALHTTLSILEEMAKTKVITPQQRAYLLGRRKDLVGFGPNAEEGPLFTCYVLDQILKLLGNDKSLGQKFLLIGLPGTGKTTTFTECVESLKRQGVNCSFVSTDELINSRFKPDDAVICAYEALKKFKIAPEVYQASNPSAKFIELYGEEPVFRDLEAMFVTDIIQSAKEGELFDFGGKALMREEAYNAAMKQKIIPIFLYAEHETVLRRLDMNDAWKKRPNYVNAVTKKGDESGWTLLAETHRKDRLSQYINASVIAIAVERNPEECFSNNSRFTRDNTKLPQELSKEILIRIKELELACKKNINMFVNQQARFFKNSQAEIIRAPNFAETKHAIETTLHFKKRN